jgi:hypothetical protein
MKQLVALIVLCAVLRPVQQPAAEPQAVQPGPAERGMVGVLRRDGLILPFAAFRGTTWASSWPVDLRYLELPVNVEAIPERWWGGVKDEGSPLPKWMAWLTDGRSAPLPVTGVQLLRVHCDTRIALRSEYQSTEPMPLMPVGPFPKDGLAVTEGVTVERIEIVPVSDPAADRLMAAVMRDLDRTEDREIGAAAGGGWRHPVPRRERGKLPVKLESWYRKRLPNGWTASYIEAVRAYPARPEDDGCGLETLFSGWVLQAAGGAQPRAQLGARITYCDRVGAMYMLPLGTVQLQGKSFWISQSSGHAAEWYAVTELDRDRARVVAEYYGGGGRGC